jgi:hypothetical protein
MYSEKIDILFQIILKLHKYLFNLTFITCLHFSAVYWTGDKCIRGRKVKCLRFMLELISILSSSLNDIII